MGKGPGSVSWNESVSLIPNSYPDTQPSGGALYPGLEVITAYTGHWKLEFYSAFAVPEQNFGLLIFSSIQDLKWDILP